MYSMDQLLGLIHSDAADRLKLQIGKVPVIVLHGEEHPMEGPPLTIEEAEHLLQSIADTRQRRELRNHGVLEFVYRFRHRADFVVRARMEGETLAEIEVH
jgi:Tfp pilus assembly pilus retraction ATPase PilT